MHGNYEECTLAGLKDTNGGGGGERMKIDGTFGAHTTRLTRNFSHFGLHEVAITCIISDQ